MSQSTHVPGSGSTRTNRHRRTRRTNGDELLALWNWFLPATLLAGQSVHGNTKWKPTQLVIQAFCWTWSARGARQAEAFDEATPSWSPTCAAVRR